MSVVAIFTRILKGNPSQVTVTTARAGSLHDIEITMHYFDENRKTEQHRTNKDNDRI